MKVCGEQAINYLLVTLSSTLDDAGNNSVKQKYLGNSVMQRIFRFRIKLIKLRLFVFRFTSQPRNDEVHEVPQRTERLGGVDR